MKKTYLNRNSVSKPKLFNTKVHRLVKLIIALIAGSLLANPLYAGPYKLRNVRSGLFADVIWASTASFQGVFLWPFNNSLSQQFEKLDSGNGYFRLRARHSGQCLMLDWRNGWVNGTPVIQYPYCGAGYAASEWTEKWVYTSRGPNGYPQSVKTLVNRATGRCLDSANGRSIAPPVQSVLQQWDCIRTAEDWNVYNQNWELDDINFIPGPLH